MAYTGTQIQRMARHALAERERRSPLWDLLVIRLTLATGLDSRQVEANIEALAAQVPA